MENSSIDILFSDDFRRAVEANLDRDPLKIALDRAVPHAALVASQVKYLARARQKLPSYRAARCVVPPRAFEQSSSEAAAARKEYSGRVAIDLTCGLGVDALALSRRFERVVALERDLWLAEVARRNFRLLGADNVTVVCAPAEELEGVLATLGKEAASRVDLVYADPDRRGERGQKLVRAEDCSPDVAAMLPVLRRVTPRLVVKLSPMFDVDEVFRVFGREGARAEVVSSGGECKEVVADVTFGSRAAPVVRAVAVGLGEAEYPAEKGVEPPARPFDPEAYRYLVTPDVALQKGRLARRYFAEHGMWIESDNGYAFAETIHSAGDVNAAKNADETANAAVVAASGGIADGGLMARVAEIAAIEPFDPKALKRRLKAEGVKGIDILRRDFPLPAAEIARSLGVREGGRTQIAFTRADGRLWQISLR